MLNNSWLGIKRISLSTYDNYYCQVIMLRKKEGMINMAKITKEKYLKINGGCKNDFQLDLQYYLVWGEYKLYKLIETEKENNFNNFRLGFREHKETKTNEYGCSYPIYTGTYDIVLNYNTSLKDDKMLITNGLGKDYILKTGLTRKTIKELQNITKELTTDKLFELIGGVQ